MTDQKTTDLKAKQVIEILWRGFNEFCLAFGDITKNQQHRFEQCDWPGMRRDTVRRLDLYPRIVEKTASMLVESMPVEIHHHHLWAAVKHLFSLRCRSRCDAEIAATFYNSVHRKVFAASAVDPGLIFTAPKLEELYSADTQLFFSFEFESITPASVTAVLSRYPFRSPFKDMTEDARLCAARIGKLTDKIRESNKAVTVEMLRSPFFRGMSAYLVGRIVCKDLKTPLVLALDNNQDGIVVDALLDTPEQLRVLFSFSRAYFHVDTACPAAVVNFLKELMPGKRIAEIYIGLGYHKHGKTELYRDLVRHQQVCSQDRFDFSPGKPGMVMIAFNMPEDDLIYKLIRDRFDTPKKTTARQVMEKYDYVFKHDRAGRLVDVQTFENLELADCCFTPRLLNEIKTQATQAADVRHDRVILRHAYVERRVTPLDLFLQKADPDAAKAMVIDYGQAIKDLARINVFAGDMLIKNFGVTRLARVVFYDYDELCPLLECNFRKLPHARRYEDELNSEPWFMVAENDVFPEEFAAFLGLSPDLRQEFLKYHGDLLQPEFWWQTQEQIRSGEWRHIRPYAAAQRLRPRV